MSTCGYIMTVRRYSPCCSHSCSISGIPVWVPSVRLLNQNLHLRLLAVLLKPGALPNCCAVGYCWVTETLPHEWRGLSAPISVINIQEFLICVSLRYVTLTHGCVGCLPFTGVVKRK